MADLRTRLRTPSKAAEKTARGREVIAQPPAPDAGGVDLLSGALIALALAPPIYLFVAIQYSALTYPFWDHVDLLPWIAALYDGHLKISSLWAPHNHSRPLFYRLIYVLNARMTHWDIRSEYIYVYLAIYGALAIHVWGLWGATGRRLGRPFLYAVVLLSIVFCSPAGHNNHWWSMMLQLDLANLFIAGALWMLATNPNGARSNLVAAALGWAATYTMTNGLVAMVVLGVMAHASQSRLFALSWRTPFWLVNLITIFGLYLHGLPRQPGGRPGLVDLARFTCVYLGAPLGDLIHYSFHGIFDQPRTTWFNGLIGLFLLLLVCFLCISGRRRIRAGETAALVLFGFSLFAIGSALVTAWGRANFDLIGVAEANSSRYTIYSSYLLYGLIVYVASLAASGSWESLLPGRLARSGRLGDAHARAVATFLLVATLIAGAFAYERGVAVYRNAHVWNDLLAEAYSFTPTARKLDRIIFPDPARAEEAKATLLQLRLGPYRNVSEVVASSPATAGKNTFDRAVRLTPSKSIREEFNARRSGLAGLAVTVVTWGHRPAGVISWELVDQTGTRDGPLAAGTVSLDSARDWGQLQIPVGYVGGQAGTRYGIVLRATTPLSQPFGFPLYRLRSRIQSDALRVGRTPLPGLGLHLTQAYVGG